MIPDRCAKASVVGQAMGEKAAMVREDGSREQDEHTWYVCTDYEPWAEALHRGGGANAAGVGREGPLCGRLRLRRGAPLLQQGARARRADRGGPVHRPLPAGVAGGRCHRRTALWSEFPVGDVSSQYLDGDITYYPLYWNEYFGQWHDGDGRAPQEAPLPRDLYRYALPNLRQFNFLCGSDDWSSDQKLPFFNGEPLYDITWFLYSGPHLTDMRRALRLQTKYSDCFASPTSPSRGAHGGSAGSTPMPSPGRGRTIWTLYNANYSTVPRGAAGGAAPARRHLR